MLLSDAESVEVLAVSGRCVRVGWRGREGKGTRECAGCVQGKKRGTRNQGSGISSEYERVCVRVCVRVCIIYGIRNTKSEACHEWWRPEE